MGKELSSRLTVVPQVLFVPTTFKPKSIEIPLGPPRTKAASFKPLYRTRFRHRAHLRTSIMGRIRYGTRVSGQLPGWSTAFPKFKGKLIGACTTPSVGAPVPANQVQGPPSASRTQGRPTQWFRSHGRRDSPIRPRRRSLVPQERPVRPQSCESSIAGAPEPYPLISRVASRYRPFDGLLDAVILLNLKQIWDS